MLHLNLGYQWDFPNLQDYSVCLRASGVHCQRATIRAGFDRLPNQASRFFDPQLYLRGLTYEDAPNVLKRLGTFPWFNAEAPVQDFEDWFQNWQENSHDILTGGWPFAPVEADPDRHLEILRNSFQFQVNFGVNRLLIPAPLTNSSQSDFTRELQWIDRGLAAIPEGNALPVYATIALSDLCFLQSEHAQDDFRQLVVDQVSSREGIQGIYLVLEQSVSPPATYITRRRTAEAILNFCHDFGSRVGLEVAVNYLDVFGLVCMAVGASSFGTGPTTKDRRLCLSDYNTRGGGGAFPKYYSHKLISDFYPKRDIQEKIVAARLIRLIRENDTESSVPLFAALANNQDINTLDGWQETRNNVQTSRLQYMESVEQTFQEFNEVADKSNWILTWLQDAERDTAYLNERFTEDPLGANFQHIRVWRKAFENFLGSHDL